MELALELADIDCKSLDIAPHTCHTCLPYSHTKRQHLRILKLVRLVKAQELVELAEARTHIDCKLLDTSRNTYHTCPPCLHTKCPHLHMLVVELALELEQEELEQEA